LATVDVLNHTNRHNYDATGRLLWQADALERTNWFGYFDWGGLESATNALGQPTRFAYDYQGKLLTTTYADGSSVSRNYDLLGRLVKLTDAAGVSTTNWYNNQGLVYAVSNAFGQVQFTAFDNRDRATNLVDANGVTNFVSYDVLGRVIQRASPADGGAETFGYSAFGLMAHTNQLGYITRFGYDVFGRSTAQTNANNEVARFAYDVSGILTNLLDGKNQSTSWKLDQYGRMTNKTDHLGNIIQTNAYDALGQLTQSWTPAKGKTVHSYDAVGNLTNVNYPLSPDVSLAYDALNRLTNRTDAVGATRYGYTSFGALAWEDGPWEQDTVSYGYTTNHLLSSVSLLQPNASPWTASLGYDAANRLTNLVSPSGAFGYILAGVGGLVQKLVLPQGAYVTNAYDALGRLTSTKLCNSTNGLLNSHAYQYDLGHQVTNQTRWDGSYVRYG
jgi:YD repeat-containing protein